MQVDGKMHVDCWIQEGTTRVGAVTCWIQQSVSPKQVVGFSCLLNKEVAQLISKFRVHDMVNPCVEKFVWWWGQILFEASWRAIWCDKCKIAARSYFQKAPHKIDAPGT